MSDNSFIAKENGKQKLDGVYVILGGGKVFQGWKNVSIQKDMQSIANGFSLEIDDRFENGKQNWPLVPGQWIAVNIGQERVVTGYIDKVRAAFGTGSRTYTIQGRSRSGDLVDCTAEGSSEYFNENIETIAEKLVKPFGIKIFTSVESKPVEKFGIKIGETIFTTLNRLARLQGFFWVSTRKGNIRLTKTGRARATSNLVENVNLLSGSIDIDQTERFSEYIVKGQTSGTENLNLTNASQPTGKATDESVSRYRPITIIAEGPVDSSTAQSRANWEATSRLAKGMSVSVSVQGWRQSDGILWGVNQIVKIKSPYLGLNTDMLISRVDHVQSENGTITNMTLVNKNSFAQKQKIKKQDDLIARLSAANKVQK